MDFGDGILDGRRARVVDVDGDGVKITRRPVRMIVIVEGVTDSDLQFEINQIYKLLPL